jgi:4-aminobutyrate aminotransferase-like enzyme
MNTSKTKILLERLKKVECPDTTYFGEKFPIVMKKGSGLNVYDVDNKHYLDFTSCFGVLALGHSPIMIRKIIQKQSKRIIHGMGDVHPTEEKIKLLELLAKVTPYQNAKSLLGLSGGDAVESAMKTAILATNRTCFLSFEGGYHGLQFGPLSLNHRNVFTSGFETWIKEQSTALPFPYSPGNILCEQERPQLEYFKTNHKLESEEKVLELLEHHLKTKKYAALIAEPIQGRGGKRELTKDFLVQAKALCKKYGTLLIYDEIYTGFGRTGKMFAHEHTGVIPDLICLGKAMGGGLPLSACTGEILDVWGKSTGEARHTQTFLGHPLACAVAIKNIEKIINDLPKFQLELENIEKEFIKFSDEMKPFAKTNSFEIRGKGFMRGIWFYKNNEGFCVPMMEYLLENGIIILPEGEKADVLSITPPLITKAKDVKKLLLKLKAYFLNNPKVAL